MSTSDNTGIEVTHEPEIPVRFVQLWLCGPCLAGEGGQCHTPGCAMFLNRAPDLPLRNNPGVTVTDAAPERPEPLRADGQGDAPVVTVDPLKQLALAWREKADEADRDRSSVVAYRIAARDLDEAIAAAARALTQ